MKKLITTSILTLILGVSAHAQGLPQPWTNGVLALNYNLGGTQFALSTNGLNGLKWAQKRMNAEVAATGITNVFATRDVLSCAAWHQCEKWGEEWKAEKTAKADLVIIRESLPEATDTQIAQIKAILGK